MSHIDTRRGVFYDVYNTIHVNEKWFFMNQTSRKYYLGKEEVEPHRTVKSKRYSTKVMFLAALAIPRWTQTGTHNSTGKFEFGLSLKLCPRNAIVEIVQQVLRLPNL